AEILDPQPGERVLDLAGAPGGKTTHISTLMQNQGLLIANDIHPRRVRALMKNVERWGARNVVVTNETPTRLADHLGAYFDRVLVDAPCSGEGLFRKEPSTRRDWTTNLVENYAKRQDGIMYEAARLVSPGGSLVYATCTFAPEENEGVVFRFLKSHPEFVLLEPPKYVEFDTGRPEWLSEDVRMFDLNRTVRLWPHRTLGEGHFVAHLVRQKSRVESLPSRCDLKKLFGYSAVPQDVLGHYRAFWDEIMSVPLFEDRLALVGSYLYHLPDDLPDLQGLSVLHWGWWLGSLKKKRFEPSSALVMALEVSDFQKVLSFPVDDPRVIRYLRGEVIPSPGPDGWMAVCVQGFPLGWGKRVRGRLKSRFPKWLRLM
ncbi:MAG: RsmF rRNA methyltransferase first C-terminal domain-containing protein, partial [Anaerolineales bacterium]